MTMREPVVALDELLRGLKRRGVPLPFEIGTFLVLEVCEGLLGAPTRVTAADIELDEDGQSSVAGGAKASEEEASRALVELLGDLLVQAAPGVPQPLLDLVEAGPSEGRWTLAQLRDDLEATLVPLNRGATRRVLARAVREARRDDHGSARGSLPPTSAELDARVDGVLGTTPQEGESSEARDVDEATHPAASAGDSPAPARPPAGHASGGDAGPAAARSQGLDDFERAASREGPPPALIGVAVAVVAVVAVIAALLWAD